MVDCVLLVILWWIPFVAVIFIKVFAFLDAVALSAVADVFVLFFPMAVNAVTTTAAAAVTVIIVSAAAVAAVTAANAANAATTTTATVSAATTTAIVIRNRSSFVIRCARNTVGRS